jgi:hypothetical protein
MDWLLMAPVILILAWGCYDTTRYYIKLVKELLHVLRDR